MKNYWLDKIKAQDEFAWKYNTEINNSVDVFSDVGAFNVKCQLPSDKDIACFRASMEEIQKILNSDKMHGWKTSTKHGHIIKMTDTFSECQE